VSNVSNLGEVSPEFEHKVFTVADEILKILKELSLENKQNIDSKQIAERMFCKDSLKGLLNDIQAITEEDELESGYLKELSTMLLDKFTELIPAYLASQLGVLKDDLHNKTLDGGSKEWLESPIEVVKNYIDSISNRNNELEDFLNKTTEHMSSSEENLSKGLSFQQRRLNEDIVFENSIFSHIDEIKNDVSGSDNMGDIKLTLMSKIENICKNIEQKRKQDMQHLMETKQTFEEMSRRMTEITREADEIRKKSKEIEYKASHDALTGVNNRKMYMTKMSEILSDVSRYDMAASLVICDIDFFMKINKKWGHKLGDLALKKIAIHIRDMMRTNDFISRYEKDVFAIILPHTGLEGAVLAGERLRAFVDNTKFTYKGENIPLTISVGISGCRKDDDINSVFERANRALRIAKESGRNRMESEE
jgi:diguanylate cyclase